MKKPNLGFISGLVAFALLIAPLGSSTIAEVFNDDFDVRSDVYDVRSDVYNGVRDDVYAGDTNEDDSNPEDTYEDAVTADVYDSVTGDVYYYYEFNDSNIGGYINENGDLIVNDMKGATFPTDTLLSLSRNKKVVFNQGNTYFSVPFHSISNYLLNSDGIQFFLNDISEQFDFKHAVSSIFSFDLLDFEDMEFADEAQGPLTVTFHVNPNAVSNWDDIVLMFMDADGNWSNEENQKLLINKETGEVSAEIYHFGAYGLFEIADAEDEEVSSDDAELEEEPNKEIDKDTEEESEKETPEEDDATNYPTDEQEEPSVTDEVYYTIWDVEKIAELTDSEGNIKLDNAKNMQLFPEVLQQLDYDKYIYLNQNGVVLAIPVKALKEIADGRLSEVEMTDVSENYAKALSSVFQYEFLFDLKEYKGELPEGVTSTFIVDPGSVNNWDDLVLRYIDEAGNITDYKDKIISYNKDTGEVIVDINRTGTYGIFEVAGSGETTPAGKEEDNQSDNKKESEPTTSTSNDENGEKSSSESENDSLLGGNLPDTATNMFNFIGIGLILLLSGFIIWIWTRKAV